MSYWDLVVKEVLDRHQPAAKFNFIQRQTTNNEVAVTTKKPKKKAVCYPLGAKYPGISLTEREAECVIHALRGKSIRKIGESLKLSARTIEYYFARIRARLNCASKSELIEKILESDFMHKVMIIEE